MWKPEYKKAKTVKVIGGAAIPTIPTGTEFEVVVNSNNGYGFVSCRGLAVNSVWNDEYVLIEKHSV